MRVKVDDAGKVLFGTFVGLYKEGDETDLIALVRVEGYGLYLKGVHPSRVTPVSDEEEATYCP